MDVKIYEYSIGVAVLISNDYKTLETVTGLSFSHVDVDYLSGLFEEFAYAVCRKKNVSAMECFSCLKELTEVKYPPTCKRILVYFFGYSYGGRLLMQDGSIVQITDLIALFKKVSNNVKLASMAKMFFFDAREIQERDSYLMPHMKRDEDEFIIMTSVMDGNNMLVVRMKYPKSDGNSTYHSWTRSFVTVLPKSMESDDVHNIVSIATHDWLQNQYVQLPYGSPIDFSTLEEKVQFKQEAFKIAPLKIMLAKLEQAKASEETIKVSYTTVLFSGSSGVGKTSLLNKLNKRTVDRFHDSSGIAKSKHSICIKSTVVIKSAERMQWVDFDHQSLISQLHERVQNLQPKSSNLASQPKKIKLSDLKYDAQFLLSSSTVSSSPKDYTPNILESENVISKEFHVEKANLVELDIVKADSSNIPPFGDIWDIINFLDTGGQPEFVNLLPAVRSSVGLTFIVFNLSKSLNSLVHVEHNVRGDPSFEPYNLDCTNLEFIKHLMVSLENFNRNVTSSLKSIKREEGGNASKICYVGTHALNISEREIEEIDDKLSSIASELELHQLSFWSSPNETLNRLFPIDMFPLDKEKELLFEQITESIRNKIQKLVQGRDYYEVPITWFIFLLKIQRKCTEENISYISYQKAVGVWMDSDSNENESRPKSYSVGQYENVSRNRSIVHNILLFFHFMGMLFYYHEVKEICDFIFIDRQWLFNKLTKLVDIKFTKAYNKCDIDADDLKRFTNEGRLNINIINNLNIDLQGIQALQFISLLKYLSIIAPISLEQNEYFMPCVLPSFSSCEKSLDLDSCYGTIQHMPLLVRFKNGPMPHGFFCHLIVELFKNLPTDWFLPFNSTSKQQHIYNNLITFPTTSGHAVMLFYKTGHLEIQVRHVESQPNAIHCDVRHKVDNVLQVVCDQFQINAEQLCYGFYCNCEDNKHFAKLNELISPTKYINCGYGTIKLTKDHLVWLQGDDNSTNRQSMFNGKAAGVRANAQLVENAVVIRQIEDKQSTPTMRDLNRYVIKIHAAEWMDIGLELGLQYNTLMIFSKNNQKECVPCFQNTLNEWLNLNPNATWGMLEVAITNVRRARNNLDPVTDVYGTS